jgi:transposase
MKIKYMTKENLMKKLEDLRTSYPKTDERPAKGDESASLYAKHITEELARRS